MENKLTGLEPRRVLYIESSMGGVVGGSLTGICHLVRGLDGERFQASLALYQDKSVRADIEGAGVRVHLLQGMQPARSGRLPRRMVNLASVVLPNTMRLAKLILAEKPAIVHACNGFRSNFDAELACQLTGVPCIAHVKGFTRLCPEERLMANRVAGVIWMTDALKRFYAAQGVSPVLGRTIYDGLDIARFVPSRSGSSVRLEFDIPAEAPCVAVAGNIQHWKGQKIVIEAVSALTSAWPDLHCLIIGGVHRTGLSYSSELKELVTERRLQKRVIFTGFRDDVASLLAAADIVVHSSVQPEPFGRVIIEGMSLGKPVIATAAGGVPEIITAGVDGLLVPPANVAAMAEAIGQLLADPATAERIGAEGKSSVTRRFSLAGHVSEVQQFYIDLLNGERSSSPEINGSVVQAHQ